MWAKIPISNVSGKRVVFELARRAETVSIVVFLLFVKERAGPICQNRRNRAALRQRASGLNRSIGDGPTRRAALAAAGAGG